MGFDQLMKLHHQNFAARDGFEIEDTLCGLSFSVMMKIYENFKTFSVLSELIAIIVMMMVATT